MDIVGFQSFKNHHPYSLDDIRSLHNNGLASGAQGLITTEKDMVKIRDLFPRDFPLLTLPIRFQMGDDFEEFLLTKLGNF